MSENIPPKVTVGLLTYNSEKTLKNSLESLVKQDYPNFKILIIDDCSSDKTVEICKNFQKRFTHIELKINKQNLGFTNNFLYLLEHIRTTYFLWACPDDWWDKSFLSTCISELEKNTKYVSALSSIKLKHSSQSSEKMAYKELLNTHSKFPFNLSKFVIKCKDDHGKTIYFNQYIHSVIRSDYLHQIFDRKGSIFFIETLIIVMMIYLGGIINIDKVLHEKALDDGKFEERHPNDNYSKKKNNKILAALTTLDVIRHILRIEKIQTTKKAQIIILVLYAISRELKLNIKIYIYETLTKIPGFSRFYQTTKTYFKKKNHS